MLAWAIWTKKGSRKRQDLECDGELYSKSNRDVTCQQAYNLNVIIINHHHHFLCHTTRSWSTSFFTLNVQQCLIKALPFPSSFLPLTSVPTKMTCELPWEIIPHSWMVPTTCSKISLTIHIHTERRNRCLCLANGSRTQDWMLHFHPCSCEKSFPPPCYTTLPPAPAVTFESPLLSKLMRLTYFRGRCVDMLQRQTLSCYSRKTLPHYVVTPPWHPTLQQPGSSV
jgi:hypothetical protein